MDIEVLVSCMNEKDYSIISRSNIQSNVVVVNQCDVNKREEFSFTDANGKSWKALFISTTERGLSRSRNMAIENSTCDICVVADDDEVFADGYRDIILENHRKYAEGIITFKLDYPAKKYPETLKKVGFIGALKTSSVQITFKREQIVNKKVLFDVKMGSGSGNGAGEETKFMVDSLKRGIKALYVPMLIAKIEISPSQWFKGYDNRYFLNRGWVNRRIMGLFLGFAYCVEFSIAKYPLYKKDNTFSNALYYQVKGLFQKR